MLPLITHVLWTLDRAGTERMVFELCKKLPAHGFRVRVVAAGGGGVMESEFHSAHIPLVIGPVVSSSKRHQTIAFLRQEFRTHRPSLLHTHLGGDLWGGLAARMEGVRAWISTVHDTQERSWFKRILRRRALRSVDHVVAISDDVEAHLASVYGRTKKRSVIRLGVEIPNLPRPPVTRRLQNFLVIGRLIPDKRVDLMIRALALIQDPWQLVILGDGPERISLEKLVSDLHLLPRVHFAGSMIDVRPFLYAADVCLFASRAEGQGMVVLEAAAARVPVIATELPALRELFDDTSMTFVPLSMSHIAWARIIEEQTYLPLVLQAKAEEARAIVQAKCSLEGMVASYAKLYQSILS